MKRLRLTAVILVLVLILTCFVTCGNKGAVDVGTTESSSTLSENISSTEEIPIIKLGESTVTGAKEKNQNYGTVTERSSVTTLTDAPSFVVKNARNYKWIAYDNFNLVQSFKSGTKLARGGYLFYIELPNTDFDHEMYLEFFASHEKVKEYSGEVAYTESGKKWYSLDEYSEGWVEHTTSKYKLCFGDSGKEFKGYVFIPADSLTYRYESKELSDVCIYVKSGIETMYGTMGNGIDFTISAVIPVEEFSSFTTEIQCENGIIDISE